MHISCFGYSELLWMQQITLSVFFGKGLHYKTMTAVQDFVFLAEKCWSKAMWFNLSAQSKGNYFFLSFSILHGCGKSIKVNSTFAVAICPSPIGTLSSSISLFSMREFQYIWPLALFSRTPKKKKKKSKVKWERGTTGSEKVKPIQKTNCSHPVVFLAICSRWKFAMLFQQQPQF